MATQGRDERGRFDEKVGDQDLLKAFDFEATVDDPYLTVKEITVALATHWGIDVTTEAVRSRLDTMAEADLVTKRAFGPGVAYRANVGPRLSDETAAAVDTVGTYDEDAEYSTRTDLGLDDA